MNKINEIIKIIRRLAQILSKNLTNIGKTNFSASGKDNLFLFGLKY